MPDTSDRAPARPGRRGGTALYVCVWDHVARTVAWLDAANGRGPHETAVRVMKIAEEAGEAVAAYIGLAGANPRKTPQGVTCQIGVLLGYLVVGGFAGHADLAVRRGSGVRKACRAGIARLAGHAACGGSARWDQAAASSYSRPVFTHPCRMPTRRLATRRIASSCPTSPARSSS